MVTTPLRRLAFAALVASSLVIGACTRSASTAPTATSVGGTAAPLSGQQATMEAVRSALLTQTAAAQGGGGATGTAAPGGAAVATSTPAVGTPVGTSPALPTATRTLPPIPTLVVPATYTLHEGEFPYCLARRFNRNPDDLLAINGLSSDTIVSPGETLSIPTSGTFPGPRALLTHPATYTVVGGDTIYSVACLYGDADPMAIAAANGLSSPYTISPGSSIQIP